MKRHRRYEGRADHRRDGVELVDPAQQDRLTRITTAFLGTITPIAAHRRAIVGR